MSFQASMQPSEMQLPQASHLQQSLLYPFIVGPTALDRLHQAGSRHRSQRSHTPTPWGAKRGTKDSQSTCQPPFENSRRTEISVLLTHMPQTSEQGWTLNKYLLNEFLLQHLPSDSQALPYKGWIQVMVVMGLAHTANPRGLRLLALSGSGVLVPHCSQL